jgi:pimeloyl-ACP methyl ester carboxylesterase
VITHVNGIDLSYEVRGEGNPIVWIAGTGISGGVWDMWQTPHFNQRYQCITLDLRGTGASDSPLTGYSVRTFADDVIGLVEHLGIEGAHFVGVSLGSAIIQELALARPDLVKSATMVSTWSSTRRETHLRRWFEARLLTLRSGAPIEVFRAFAFWMSSPTIIDLEPELHARVQEFFAANSATQPVHAYVGHFEADLEHDTMDRLGQITCPTLVAYGEEDLITLPRYNETVADLIPGSRRHVIPRAGHFAWVERGAELNAAIDSFLHDIESSDHHVPASTSERETS